MFKIIPAQEQHLTQLVKLISYTNYDIATAKYNTLNLDKESYIIKYRIKPSLQHTVVVIDDENENDVLGMATFSTIEQLENCKHTSYSPPEIHELFKPYSTFQIPNSYYISRMAIHQKWRRRGIGKMLIEAIENKARENGLLDISLLCWSGQISAIKFCIDMGMSIMDTIKFNKNLPHNILLYFEKNLACTSNISDYFDTSQSHILKLI